MSEEEIANFARSTLEAANPAADPSARVQWNFMIGGEMVHIVGSRVEDILIKMERKVEEVRIYICYLLVLIEYAYCLIGFHCLLYVQLGKGTQTRSREGLY